MDQMCLWKIDAETKDASRARPNGRRSPSSPGATRREGGKMGMANNCGVK